MILAISLTACETPLQRAAMPDSVEAKTLMSAYLILATGNHDYGDHRILAMKEVKAAGDWLGIKLRGFAQNDQPQAASDANLLEARSQIQSVLDAAEIKNQDHVAAHLQLAIAEIDIALSIH